MNSINVRCPCCGNDIHVNLKEYCEDTDVSIDKQYSENNIFEIYGICFGVKGGDTVG